MDLHQITWNKAEANNPYGLTDEEIEEFWDDVTSTVPGNHHPLIKRPFSWKLPIPGNYFARFKPVGHNANVFFGSELFEGSVYEMAYHFMKSRAHADFPDTAVPYIGFRVEYDEAQAMNLRTHPDIAQFMDKNNSTAANNFIKQTPGLRGVLYPSCRHPNNVTNAAIYQIHDIQEQAHDIQALTFRYNTTNKRCFLLDTNEAELFSIDWATVS